MGLRCECGEKCIIDRRSLLEKIQYFYNGCKNCHDPHIDKRTPLGDQLNLKSIDRDWGRCECGKRHLDSTMGHILSIMVDKGLLDKESSLRNVGTPLMTIGYPLSRAPFLPSKSLLILSDKLDKKTAKQIIGEVPEVKGVIKGDPGKTVGMLDSDHKPIVYEKLAGCDMRCDIIKSPRGALCIYKRQSRMHIESLGSSYSKIMNLYNILRKFKGPFKVIDATCGPGTLGLFSLFTGADKVIFNDIWTESIKTTIINLEVNGFKLADEKFEVYNEDIRDLPSLIDEKYDLCIIDPFPNVDTTPFVKTSRKLAKEIILIC
ncbi:MAG TPA: methyltransferase [Methanothermobacter sp.]|nr:methyltransferase [Methanothermobacter sp.]